LIAGIFKRDPLRPPLRPSLRSVIGLILLLVFLGGFLLGNIRVGRDVMLKGTIVRLPLPNAHLKSETEHRAFVAITDVGTVSLSLPQRHNCAIGDAVIVRKVPVLIGYRNEMALGGCTHGK
jgi:hypothetical protein